EELERMTLLQLRDICERQKNSAWRSVSAGQRPAYPINSAVSRQLWTIADSAACGWRWGTH
ncbi:hypothetical protein, partial [Anaerotruncus colihominis]|uniref:hypothetical protein n=1 Tax=Anaerotruncus colihominis TaxID=169435 RepID=UPI00210E4E9F